MTVVKTTTDYIIRTLFLGGSTWYVLSFKTTNYTHLGVDCKRYYTSKPHIHSSILYHPSVEDAEIAYCTWLLSNQ